MKQRIINLNYTQTKNLSVLAFFNLKLIDEAPHAMFRTILSSFKDATCSLLLTIVDDCYKQQTF